MHRTYRVMRPEVIADIIDGEAVIMNLKTGSYFNSEGTGSECWDALASGFSVAQIVDQLSTKYDADRTTIAATVEEFVQDLLAHSLIAPDNAPPRAVVPQGSSSPPAPFHAPVLNVYSDMKDLLLLDPIHDVDVAGWPMPHDVDVAGWPMPKGETAA